MPTSFYKIILSLFIFLSVAPTFGQDSLYTSTKKGKVFIAWGGNRASYSYSDIHFTGENYDFTIENVGAHDKPKGWHLDYFNPARLTIPQTNFRLGYFISDKYAVIVGFDHMKYVINRNRVKNVNGVISLPNNEPGSVFNGVYAGETFVSEDLLKFEYTDGLNYVTTELARYDDISKWFGITNTDILQINATEGIGVGVLFPRTNSTLLFKDNADEFSVSGYGTSINLGLNFTLFKHFYIQTDLKGGYINMTDAKTTNNSADKATHHFLFLQRIITLGGIFRL